MTSFTRSLLLAVVTLATNMAFTMASTSTALPGCQTPPVWLTSINTNVGGGQQQGSTVNTPALCQAACLANSNCVGADFVLSGSTCWLLISGSVGQRNNGTSPGVTHYDLISRGSSVACPAASSSAPPSCSNSWTLSANTNYAGGTGLSSATTLTDCQNACIAAASCVAIDFNPAASPQCYWLSTLSGTKFSGQNSGISHYDLNRCVTTTTTTTQAPAPCTYTWASSANTNYAGGTGLSSATTLASCQAACIATANCVAIDFNANASPQCYWLTSLSGTKFSGQNSGITHYDLTRSCNGAPALYSIIFHKYGGLLAVDPMSGQLRVVDDFNKATMFQTISPCLATSNSGFTSTANCASYSPVNMPGYYMRSVMGVMFVQNQTGQISAARFAEDASFYVSVDTLSAGYTYVQPVTYPNNVFYYIRGCDDSVKAAPFNSSIMYTDSASFAAMSFPAPPSSAPTTGTCMLTWTRTSGARGPLMINKGYQSLDYCRQLCIVTTDCSGVSYGWGVCFLETVASKNYALVAAPMFVYFDLVATFNGSCAAGCQSTWLLKNQYLTNYMIYTSNMITNVFDCRHSCTDDGYCIGINWNVNNGVNNCTKYYTFPNINMNVMPSRSSYSCCNQNNNYSGSDMPNSNGNGMAPGMPGGMPGGFMPGGSGSGSTTGPPSTTANPMNNWAIWNGTVSFFAVTKSFSQCGSCSPKIQIIPGVTDLSGVTQAGVIDRDSCRTGCINNVTCTGFGMVNNNQCYFSFTRKPTLTSSTTTTYFDLTRNPCGNGCQDKWDFYPESSASGLTQQNYATENACRLACQADATCTIFDWNYSSNSCWWGTRITAVRNVPGTSTGWNHYELVTQPYCDED